MTEREHNSLHKLNRGGQIEESQRIDKVAQSEGSFSPWYGLAVKA
jgi:hypothetical protein